MIFQSIRWRLQLWHALILVAVLAGFGFTAFQLQHAGEMRRVDQELEQRVSLLLRSLHDTRPPGRGGPRPPGFRPTSDLAGALGAEAGFYYVIWRRDGEVLAASTNAPGTVPEPPPMSAGREQGGRERGLFRERHQYTPPGECVLVGRSIAPEEAALRRFALTLSALGAGVLALGLAGGWWVASRAIRPIRAISVTASRIASGDLSQRIPPASAEDELGQLAGVLNSTFARLEAAFAQQARFTADASHELRTPVTVLLNQTQSALARERPAAEYRETIEACQRAAQRMRRLIESLLTLARLDAGQEHLRSAPLDLAKVAAECLDLVRPLAAERGIRIQADLAPAPCHGDADRLALVVTNLLTNAIHHNRDGGEVRVHSAPAGNGVSLSVADTGPGIAPEHLPHLFERFYRVDTARTTAQGRTGLGLAISKAIVDAHAGRIEVASEPGAGTTFTLHLPAGPSGGAGTAVAC